MLAKIPGLLDTLEASTLEKFAFYSVVPEDKGLLGSGIVGHNHALHGVRRLVFHKALIDAAERHGVGAVRLVVEPRGQGQAGATPTDKEERKQDDATRVLYLNNHPLLNTRLLV